MRVSFVNVLRAYYYQNMTKQSALTPTVELQRVLILFRNIYFVGHFLYIL